MTLQTLVDTYFKHMDAKDSRPLHSILHDCLAQLIDTLPDQSEFPSERSLSEALNVHRNTLHKALEPFLLRGLLVRRRHQTLVSHVSKPADTAPGDTIGLHPLQLQVLVHGTPMPVRSQTITLRLYESLPLQRQFWQETIAAFQRTHPTCTVDVQTTRCKDFKEYHDHLQQDAPDLFQLPVPFSAFQNSFQDLLAPLPDDLFSPQLHLTELYDQSPSLLRSCCPISFALWHHLVNLNLAERYHLDLADFTRGGTLTDVAQSCQNLPEDTSFVIHTDSMTTALGLPIDLTSDGVRRHSLKLFRILSSLKHHELISRVMLAPTEHFIWFDSHVLQRFMDGKLVCHTGTLPALLNQFPQYQKLNVRSFLMFPTDEDCRLNVAAVALGLSTKTTKRDECAQFLRHLLSDREQERLMRLTQNLPFNRQVALEAPMMQGYVLPPQDIIRRFRIIGRDIMATYWSGRLGHALWFQKILRGTCTPEEAADQFTEAFARTFPEQLTH